MLLKNKFVIGCLVQFYELDIIEDYIRSVRYSIEDIENKENIKVDICLNMNEELEQIDTEKITSHKIVERMDDICAKHNVDFWVNKDRLFTIADYRREFNDYYCQHVDVLMWGETDSLIPKILHNMNRHSGTWSLRKFVFKKQLKLNHLLNTVLHLIV